MQTNKTKQYWPTGIACFRVPPPSPSQLRQLTATLYFAPFPLSLPLPLFLSGKRVLLVHLIDSLQRLLYSLSPLQFLAIEHNYTNNIITNDDDDDKVHEDDTSIITVSAWMTGSISCQVLIVTVSTAAAQGPHKRTQAHTHCFVMLISETGAPVVSSGREGNRESLHQSGSRVGNGY